MSKVMVNIAAPPDGTVAVFEEAGQLTFYPVVMMGHYEDQTSTRGAVRGLISVPGTHGGTLVTVNEVVAGSKGAGDDQEDASFVGYWLSETDDIMSFCAAHGVDEKIAKAARGLAEGDDEEDEEQEDGDDEDE